MTAHIGCHRDFVKLTGDAAFPWQAELCARFVSDEPDKISSSCNLPTGWGKTTVVAIWLLTLASRPENASRPLVYVVTRRTVVDRTTTEAEKLRRVKTGPFLTRRLGSSAAGGRLPSQRGGGRL